MCGRYTLYHEGRELDRLFEAAISEVLMGPRYNIAPTQEVLIVRETLEGEREARRLRWGLLPYWVKDQKAFKVNLFNARAEGVADKPSFREPFKRRRCLVPCIFQSNPSQEFSGRRARNLVQTEPRFQHPSQEFRGRAKRA